MDFFTVKAIEKNNGVTEVYPNFIVTRSEDLMIKGRDFYAVWIEEEGLWSRDEYRVQPIVDRALQEYADKVEGKVHVKYLRNFDSGQWSMFQKYVKNLSDNAEPLDNQLTFANDDTKKDDYVTKKLPYSLEDGDHSAWDEVVDTLYTHEERTKIEWAIGSIVSGESRNIQKFMVFYGPPGSGKSTVMNVIHDLFRGYEAVFDAKALGSNNNTFSAAAFKHNPLVAIQQDGDLSKIQDNTILNAIVSHEDILINEKGVPAYPAKINAFLFMGTNQPVMITDARSGIIRRLIDVEPTGEKLPPKRYQHLVDKIKFEHGAIAKHCLDIFNDMGPHYYDTYRPVNMMYKTDPMLNFVSDNYDILSSMDHITAKHAYDLYRQYAEDSGIERPMNRQKFQNELGNYYEEFHDRYIDGTERKRSVFVGFDMDKIAPKVFEPEPDPLLELGHTSSIFDKEYSKQPAQLAKADGTPKKKWDNVSTQLDDIDTSKLHYVKVPPNHIVIDFDIPGPDGTKDLEANLKAAAKWPETYAELSKSGKGVHLHYIYTGDVDDLDPQHSDHIEVKVYKGNSSLRRKLTECNDLPITNISSGLKFKEKVDMATADTMQSERSVRNLIDRNLRKEIHSSTKSSVDFIKKILDDAYDSGIQYDLTDMRGVITAFAAGSSNQSLECIKTVQQMKFASNPEATPDDHTEAPFQEESPIVFFDVEVFKNKFLICWKYQDSDQVQSMIDPQPAEVEKLFQYRLVGFNNRRYDNHILYARYLGYNNSQLFDLSQGIIEKRPDVYFREAYGLSYADIYDFASKKQSLKKWEIDLGIDHLEWEHDWNEPLPDDMIDKAIEYCINDVRATEAVFDERRADFTARQILAELSGLPVNTSGNTHAARIIFGNNRYPQKSFNYVDLSKQFEGYKFDEYAPKGTPKSFYKGVDVGEGGYVYSEPGMYHNVAVLDIASMHPTSIEQLNLFGPYTERFSELKDARLAIKHGKFDKVRTMLDGRLKKHVEDESRAGDLSNALKIVINSVYGLTAAKFDNPFRDPRNKDNIVAKRGALFMVDLQEMIESLGFRAIHIKTDSVKIPNATPEVIQKVIDFGKEYGYDFEHEDTYDAFCLVNKAVYIARIGDKWDAVGAEFQHPVVFKSLFSGESILFDDYVETRQVSKGSIFLANPDDEEDRIFLGKIGTFVPVKPGSIENYGNLVRVVDDKAYAVSGSSGHFWAREVDASMVGESCIDTNYAETLVDKARAQILKYGTLEDLHGTR